MVGMAGLTMTEGSIRAHIATAITIIVQLQRFPDGKRRVTSISELTGIDGNVVQMQELFRFVRAKPASDGSIGGEFRATGLRPKVLDVLQFNGAHISDRALHPGWPQ
jgi:pilus assembly protein CpaF